MLRFVLVSVLVLGVVAVGQDKDKAAKDDKPVSVAKGQLPSGWKKLGLSKAQVQSIYKTQGEFREKRQALLRQLDELKVAEREALLKHLSETQRKLLKDMK